MGPAALFVSALPGSAVNGFDVNAPFGRLFVAFWAAPFTSHQVSFVRAKRLVAVTGMLINPAAPYAPAPSRLVTCATIALVPAAAAVPSVGVPVRAGA